VGIFPVSPSWAICLPSDPRGDEKALSDKITQQRLPMGAFFISRLFH